MNDQNKPDQPIQPVPEPPAPPAPPASPAPAQPASPQSAAAAQPTAPFGQPQMPGVPGTGPAVPPPAPGQPAAPGQQPAAQPGYYQPAPQPASNGKAIGALVCGILAILFSGTVLIGIVLGIVAIVLAAKAVQESGKDGKATGGKVCGILGIVFSIITFILYVVLGLGVLAVIANSDATVSSFDAASSSGSDAPSLESSEDEANMEAAASAQLDLLAAKDAAIVQKLAAEADEQMAEEAGYSLTDLGMDPTVFIEWMMADFSYELDGAYDNGDGTATVFADVTMRDSVAFATTFMEDAQAALDSGEMQGMDEAQVKTRLGELYQAAMDKTTGMAPDYVSVELEKVGDTWQVDEDAWESELDRMFGL